MKSVLVTVAGGIIEQVIFFENPKMALKALATYVKTINMEHQDAAVYGPDGFIANAKHFLDDEDNFIENESLIERVSTEVEKSIYIIGNPQHRLGFMIASPDDPLGYVDPVEALADLGQMRKDHGRHLKLYQAVPVVGAIAERTDLEEHNADCEVEDFDYSLVEEHLL